MRSRISSWPKAYRYIRYMLMGTRRSPDAACRSSYTAWGGSFLFAVSVLIGIRCTARRDGPTLFRGSSFFRTFSFDDPGASVLGALPRSFGAVGTDAQSHEARRKR